MKNNMHHHKGNPASLWIDLDYTIPNSNHIHTYTHVRAVPQCQIRNTRIIVSRIAKWNHARGYPNDKRKDREPRDTRRSSPVNFEASNEKQLGRHALRFCRFAGVVAEIERIQAWTHDGMELTEQRTEVPGIAASWKRRKETEEGRGEKKEKKKKNE